MKLISFLILLIVIPGCKGSNSTSTKSLFSLWTYNPPTGCSGVGNLDLSAGKVGTNFTAKVYGVPNCECDCTASFSGTTNGFFTLTSCTFVPGNGCSSYTFCSNFNTSANAGFWNINSNQILNIDDTTDWGAFNNACLYYK